MRKDVLINFQVNVKNKKRLNELVKQTDKLKIVGNKAFGQLKTSADKVDESLDNLKKSLGLKQLKILNKQLVKSKYLFEGQYLSIMFFGMLIQRVFSSIKNAGINTFTKIMEATDELIRITNPAYQAINALGAEFDYLRFSVGQALGTALQPLLPVLSDILDKITSFINKHPKLVSAIITIGIAFGSIVGTLASLKLGLSALKWLLGDFTGVVLGLKAAFVGLSIAGIAYFIWWLVIAGKKLGGFKELFKSVIRGLYRVGASFSAALYASWTKLFSWIIEKLVWLNKKINIMISAFNAVSGKFGLKIPLLPTTSLYRFVNKNSWKNLFAAKMWEYEEALNKIEWLKPQKGYLEKGSFFNPNTWEFTNQTQPQVNNTFNFYGVTNTNLTSDFSTVLQQFNLDNYGYQ